MHLTAKCILLSSAVLLHTGCMSAYTSQELRDEVAVLTPRLPFAQLMPGTGQGEARIIVLKGRGSLFNNAPLLDEGWLNGKMTQAEYVQAISSINEAVGQSLVGHSKTFSPSDIPELEDRKAAVAAERIAALNAIWQDGGVHFTSQRAQEHQTMVDENTTERSTDTFVYLRVK